MQSLIENYVLLFSFFTAFTHPLTLRTSSIYFLEGMNTKDQNINYTFQDLPTTTAKQADCNILYFVWANVKKIHIKNAQLKTVHRISVIMYHWKCNQKDHFHAHRWLTGKVGNANNMHCCSKQKNGKNMMIIHGGDF